MGDMALAMPEQNASKWNEMKLRTRHLPTKSAKSAQVSAKQRVHRKAERRDASGTPVPIAQLTFGSECSAVLLVS